MYYIYRHIPEWTVNEFWCEYCGVFGSNTNCLMTAAMRYVALYKR